MTGSKKPMSFWMRSQAMGWAALIMGLSILLSRFMGLIRDKVISFLYGATRESDVYFAAFVIPDFINYLLAGAYFSITLIPLLAAYFEADEEDGWKFFSAVFLWIGIAISLLTAVGFMGASYLARLAAPGLGPIESARLALFLRIILPAQIFFLLGSCITAILYLRKQFFVPALTPILYNLFIILGGILLRHRGMDGFCWGVLGGAFLGNFLLPCLAAMHGGGLRISLTFRHRGLRRFVILALPLMLGQSIVVLDEQLIRIFGSLVGVGVISWLNYARRIMLVPVGVVAQAAGVASYPFLAELLAAKEITKFHETLNTAIRRVVTLLIPLSFWMILMSEPTIRLLFEQGSFGAVDTERTATLLRIMLVGVCSWGIQQILGRGFYAHQDTISPALLGTLSTILSLPIFYFLGEKLHATGIALASAVSITLYTCVLGWWWRHRYGGEAFLGLGGDLLKLTALSIVALSGGALASRVNPLSVETHPYWASLLTSFTGSLGFSILFLPLALRFVPHLIEPFLQRVPPLERLLCRFGMWNAESGMRK